jgi:hypothetical protein
VRVRVWFRVRVSTLQKWQQWGLSPCLNDIAPRFFHMPDIFLGIIWVRVRVRVGVRYRVRANITVRYRVRERVRG